MGRNETRRQFLRLTGGAALFGFAGTASANDATDPVSTAPVPGDPGQFTYATMGEGSNPTATLYGNFKCPYTKEFVLGNLEAVVEEFVEPGKLDLRYRALAYEPPGQSSHGSSYYYISDSDPRISECAMGAWDLAPDDYWAFFRDMFESQVSGTVTYDEMRSRMNDSDVDHRWGAISRAKDGDYEDPVYQTRYAAGDVGVTFTPTLALDGATTAPHHGTQELLDWIAGHLPEDGGGTTSSSLGESGTRTVRQDPAWEWHDQSLSQSYDAPVVIAKSTTYDGPDPVHVRLRSVADDRFEFRLDEWAYEDGTHTSERLGYVALEEGTHSLDGPAAEVGRITTDHRFAYVDFDQAFGSTPVVFSQPQTRRGEDGVVSRHRWVSADGVGVRLQEREAGGWHTEESVGYLAVEPGRGTLDGAPFEVGRTGWQVTDDWHEISFDGDYADPQFVADIQTYNGPDTATVRYRNLSSDGVEVHVDEERSDDDETNHWSAERVGYLVFEGA
ncbi:DsbA family protein [Halomicrococcus sp. SG-WS-1]|uniref:DsbA family protein n=1 Tax=Halomicrococcus sp. SG-WS-1 TaxID=3439057 RepID=UPI003F792725